MTMYYEENRTKRWGRAAMFDSRSHLTKPAIQERRLQEDGEDIRYFLERELPPGKRNEAVYLTHALLKAGARYDRYIANRDDWLDYAKRRRRLEKAGKSA